MTQPTPTQIPAPGTILLSRYRVERQLGQGGMGVVLAVRHIDLDKLFAFKLLLPQALEYPDAKERFLREARAAARLSSEHVTRVT
ncbi:MAG TPA: serine/threonine protein kinase, partial [Polyangium sp.]|nr:serine/threonine protein kinase [Polyangium sp.]